MKKCLRCFFSCFVLITPIRIKWAVKSRHVCKIVFLLDFCYSFSFVWTLKKSAIKKGFWIYGFSVENHLFGHHKNRQSQFAGSSRAATSNRCRFAVLKSIFVWRMLFTLISWKTREKYERKWKRKRNEKEPTERKLFLLLYFDWDVVYFSLIFLFACPAYHHQILFVILLNRFFFFNFQKSFTSLRSLRRKIWHKICVSAWLIFVIQYKLRTNLFIHR